MPQPSFRPRSIAILVGLAMAAVGGTGCEGVRRPPSPPPQAIERPPVPAEAPVICAATPGYDLRGTASWYGRAHHGRETASGEIFDMHGLTAAHRTLPFGTRIRVTNLKNGRTVVLTVNDRGPFVRNRVLDVSHRAAQELDFLEESLAPIRIESVTGC